MVEAGLPELEVAFREQTLKDYQALLESTKIIPDVEMRKAVESFLKEHYLNIDFFTLVPESQYGVRVAAETPQGPPASTRDNLEHVIANIEDRVHGFEQGEYKWGIPDPTLKQLSKTQLLERLMKDDKRILELAQDPANTSRQITTPFGPNTPSQFIQNLVPHQIFHQGIHMGLMDKMGMARPESYVKRWGK